MTTLLLLDSQAVVWLLDDSARLGARARELIQTAGGVYVSAASVWELTIKSMLGKLTIPADLASRLRQQGLVPLSVTAEHAEGIREFPELLRHDPFDRLLVAQAHRSGLRLLTADQVLLGLGRDFVIDATV
ncbi:type II toxin-antitoxin system VapC family toxin [Pseudonocardia spinosispora]|uniref:type II toxin-antitoxin system VapC family toxin n=1 Tax=Pseudonocardia spinosispora TaxID=103441 RepID=UPI00048C8A1E|nr:type II toxin-antitoxin system VapC family toxin [Pseudonocardia spinosispora]